jgi:hypothetical protein
MVSPVARTQAHRISMSRTRLPDALRGFLNRLAPSARAGSRDWPGHGGAGSAAFAQAKAAAVLRDHRQCKGRSNEDLSHLDQYRKLAFGPNGLYSFVTIR